MHAYVYIRVYILYGLVLEDCTVHQHPKTIRIYIYIYTYVMVKLHTHYLPYEHVRDILHKRAVETSPSGYVVASDPAFLKWWEILTHPNALGH